MTKKEALNRVANFYTRRNEMTPIMKRSGAYPLAKAQSIVEEMRKHDEDFKYVAVDLKNGLGRIEVYDEEGFLIDNAFVL